MRLDHVFTIAKREYLLRLKGKAFWLSTLGMPLLVLAATVLPSLLLSLAPAQEKMVVVDVTGKIAPELRRKEAAAPSGEQPPAKKAESPKKESEIEFVVEPPKADRARQAKALDQRVLDGEISAWILIDEAALSSGRFSYRARSTSGFVTQSVVERRLSNAVRRARLAAAGLDPARAEELMQDVELDTVRVSVEGGRLEVGLAGAALAYIVFMMLFVAIQIWGQQVMTGILDEKSSRIVEVLVSAVRPFELMLGKLLGIGSVGLTQFAIWILTAAVVTSPGVAMALAYLPKDVTLPSIGIWTALHLVLFFVLGFFVFSSFYAALGAAFNNIQEAQQMAAPLILLLVVPVFLAPRLINDPDSTLSVVLSLVPIFSPLLMTLRLAIRMPPLWQVLLAEVLTASFVVLMVWASARIYRVGILMYGKKPTFGELARWLRRA
ncbi:MAG TPA: ABC transporter permease [Thermoanaerobaculia bacterium]|jgi:ABC-2 type transport system permease protein|nr:ABC transporter permease [Thermoanaerobaculia bacterium]